MCAAYKRAALRGRAGGQAGGRVDEPAIAGIKPAVTVCVWGAFGPNGYPSTGERADSPEENPREGKPGRAGVTLAWVGMGGTEAM